MFDRRKFVYSNFAQSMLNQIGREAAMRYLGYLGRPSQLWYGVIKDAFVGETSPFRGPSWFVKAPSKPPVAVTVPGVTAATLAAGSTGGVAIGAYIASMITDFTDEFISEPSVL